jgi:lysophospholipase L1-like esterase
MLLGIILLSLLVSSCGIGDAKTESVPPATIQMIGNSIFAWNHHGIRAELDELYNGLEDKHRTIVNDVAVVGSTINYITEQWNKVRGAYDVVILDGGANDAFFNAWWCWTQEGKEIHDQCKVVIEDASQRLGHLIQDIRSSGVKRVVLVVPYHLRGPAKNFNPVLDYSIPLWPALCPAPWCTLADLSNWIKPEDESLYYIDGIHPSSKGSRRIARVIYNLINDSQVTLD